MLSYNEIRENKEISKLIQYGYDLHKKEMGYHLHKIPNFEFYNGNSCPMKVVENGGIFGMRRYPNHSQSYLCTTLGLCVGKVSDGDFEFDYAQMFQTNNDDFMVCFANLKIDDNKKHWYKILDYDWENSWDNMSDEDKVSLFVKSMKFVGFREQDILAVLNGNMKAREAYINVAPDDIKNLQWVNKNRRYYIFDGNVAIEGVFGSMNMDDFPFPFEEQPVLDCAKVKTSCVYFEKNYRKVKLINVNENPDSIKYTNLRNAIIDEPIDLSRVDATGTKFGHHTVINLGYSIAKLDKMDLSLAVNENGEKYVVDKNGVVQFEDIFTPKTIAIIDSLDTKVLSNADNAAMTKLAIRNGADGIGLVRTEHIFENIDDIEKMIDLLVDYPEEDDLLGKIKELQSHQARDVLANSKNKRVIFRLMDFKLKEYLKVAGLGCDCDEEYIGLMRGAYILERKDDLLLTQLEAIFEEASKVNAEVNLLIPMIKGVSQFTRLKEEIIKLSKNYNLQGLKIGAMIESREMVNDADLLAREADFISIGTNDLTESLTGLSRDTNSIEFLELTREVKSAIKEIIYRARSSKPDIDISVCGEHSNYIENIQFYNDIGINYITCNPDFVGPNKEFINNNLKLETGKVKQLSIKSRNDLN